MTREILTAMEVAAVLKVSKWKVYKLTKAGDLPYFLVGRSRRYNLSEVMEYLRYSQAWRTP